MSEPKEGDKVLINANAYGADPAFTIEATVVDNLSVQFTARWEMNGALSFLFYNDEGSTWIKK